MTLAHRTLPWSFIAAAWACSSSPSTPDAGPRADAGDSAEATVGAAGGTLTLGPVRVEVPAGAVSEPTVFRVRALETAPALANRLTAISGVYRLEPARSFAKPVRVTITVDRGRVPAAPRGPADGLLLLKAPAGTQEFEVVGAAWPDAIELSASVTSFSDVVAAFLGVIGCEPVAVDACSGSCDPRTGSCTGSCTLYTDDARLTARCTATLDHVECTCSSTDPTKVPATTGPLALWELTSGWATATAYDVLVRCGWPCGATPSDAGSAPREDAMVTVRDAEVAPDAPAPPDSGTAMSWTPELVASSADWMAFDNFRVAAGWITWANPMRPEIRAMRTDGTGNYVVHDTGVYDRAPLEILVGTLTGPGLVTLGGTTVRPVMVEEVDMSLRPAGFAPGYTGIGPTSLYGNDPHYDPLASRKVNPFSSLPLTGGRATVINDHLNAGPIEVTGTDVYFYGSDRDAPSVCGLFSERGGFPLVPDEVLCRSGSSPIRITPTFVLWGRIDATSQRSLVVLRRSDLRLREFSSVRRAFAASGDYLYYLDLGGDLARTRLDGDGTPEPLGIHVSAPTIAGMEPGGDGYVYWAVYTGGMGSIYRMAVP